MRAILETLPKLLNRLPDEKTREAVVFAVWPSVIGEHLRERSASKQLNENTLQVAVANADWKKEFEQHASSIIFKLNGALGTSVVKRIEFIVDPAAFKQMNTVAKSTRSEPAPDLVSRSVAAAAKKIADAELRSHFIEAAIACSNRK